MLTRKLWSLLALLLALSLILVACGGGADEEPADTGDTAAEPAEETAAEPAEDTAAEPAAEPAEAGEGTF